ncbi:MAG: patatin-like phospholipase family protein [Proteobacteria bacterium]|nr:patatin-like phospholipase family protein [Pseudomonadota bacterium]
MAACARATLLLVISLTLAACGSAPRKPEAPIGQQPVPVTAPVVAPVSVPPSLLPPPPPPPRPIVIPPPKIALVLGGGAARGFAHVGVIKMLESQGLAPDMIVGTSAGSVVGALYAAGITGFDLQRRALDLDEKSVSDWALPNRGFIKGESLQKYINDAVKGRAIDKLAKPLGVVATDLHSGESVVFRRGNTGMAVRASSSVPGVFQPVIIDGREFVDGGLTSPVPVKAARDMGADIVIAVDISQEPLRAKVQGTIDVLLQTFLIMGRTIAAQELQSADVVVSPATAELASASFDSRHLAILEGEKAALAAVPRIRERIAAREDRLRKAAQAAQAAQRQQ